MSSLVMRTRALVTALVVAALSAGRAEAYVRKTNNGNNPVFWKSTCVPVTIYLNGFDKSEHKVPTMTVDAIVKSITAAAHAWSTDAVTCSDGSSPSLEIVPTMAAVAAKPPPAAYDAKNSLIFRTDIWAKSGISGGMRDYDPSGLAITTVTSEGDGHIVDVDVEVNATNPLITWINLDPGVVPPQTRGDTTEYYDLQNALTHEFGHFIGLDHTCFTASKENPLVGTDGRLRGLDNAGNKIPDCGDGSPSIVQQTVMYNVSPAQEITKRTLSQDDINGVCDIYPASRIADACTMDQPPPGCSVAPRARASGAPGPVSALIAAAVVAGIARRRRLSGRRRARA
jgi:hypothetical protein